MAAPTEVRNLTVSFPPSSTTVHISWKQPIPSNGKLSNYTVQYRVLNSNITLTNLTIDNEIEITNLKPFTDYEIRVRVFLYKIIFLIGFLRFLVLNFNSGKLPHVKKVP